MAGSRPGGALQGKARSRLERFLRIFGDVRAGDGPMVVLLGLQVFLLLTAYYLLKTVREPLILLTTLGGIGGGELKTYGTVAQAVLLLGFVPIYARISARLDRWRLVRGTLLSFAATLAAFIALGLAGVPIGAPFYLWLGIISLLQVAQFWSVANDLYDRSRGERLFGIIAIGGSLGAIAGAQLAQWLIRPLGVYPLMALAAGVYLVVLPLGAHVEHVHRRELAARGTAPAAPPAPPRGGALRLVLRDRYLLFLGVMLLLANLVNTQGEYILAETIKAQAETQPAALQTAYIGRFYGAFYSIVNGISLGIQALFVARLMRHVGVRAMLFVLPAAALVGYSVIAVVPVLAVVALAKGFENSVDYSLQNTLKQALFLPTSRQAKYAGKATIDTTFVRLGDTLAAGVVFLGVHVFSLSRAGFAIVNILLVLAWIVVGVSTARRHRELSGDVAAGPPPSQRGWQPAARVATGVAAISLAFLLSGCASGHQPTSDPVRPFPARAVAWHEHDDQDVARRPERTDLSKLDITLLVRDSVPNEVDYHLALDRGAPARDVNALDEVPCSTWFCPRNHLRPVAPEVVAAGAPGQPPVFPVRIVKGKSQGAAMGFEVKDAVGRKFLLKLDPAGHLGLGSAAEIVGSRLFHAAGYNVPSSFVVDLRRGDLLLDTNATYELYGVKDKPLSARRVEAGLSAGAVHEDGRLHAALVSWVDGDILGAFDMIGRRSDDPNDRIPHEDRRSLRASWVLVAWLGIVDASAINTLDSYVEERGRHFVRHYFIDFGAGLGSASLRPKGPHEGQEHLVELGRSLGAFAALGFYRRPYEGLRDTWEREVRAHRAVGWFPAEEFDPEHFRTNRKVPAHRRMTDRDAYWGAKVVTSFSDAQLDAVAVAAKLEDQDETDYLAHALKARRDIIGRRYLRAMTAVEQPELSPDGRSLCFDDLALARGYAHPAEVRYVATVRRRAGEAIGVASAPIPARAPRTCLLLPSLAEGAASDRYRIIEVATSYGSRPAKPARIHIDAGRVVGLERAE